MDGVNFFVVLLLAGKDHHLISDISHMPMVLIDTWLALLKTTGPCL